MRIKYENTIKNNERKLILPLICSQLQCTTWWLPLSIRRIWSVFIFTNIVFREFMSFFLLFLLFLLFIFFIFFITFLFTIAAASSTAAAATATTVTWSEWTSFYVGQLCGFILVTWYDCTTITCMLLLLQEVSFFFSLANFSSPLGWLGCGCTLGAHRLVTVTS